MSEILQLHSLFWSQCNAVTPEVSNSFVAIWDRDIPTVRVAFSKDSFSLESRDNLFALLALIMLMSSNDRDKAIAYCETFLECSRAEFPSFVNPNELKF